MDRPPTDPEPLPPRLGRLTLVFLAMVAVGLTVGALVKGDAGPAAAGPAVGRPAPDAEAAGFDGTVWRLSDHLAADGRTLVLNLWASWCPPCREEIPDLSRFAAANPDVSVVGVAVDDTEAAARRFAEEVRPAFLLAFDATGELRRAYPSLGLPVTFVIAPDGTVLHRVDGRLTLDQLASLVG